jgi:uncharacterized RDD family membrane protein YckC
MNVSASWLRRAAPAYAPADGAYRAVAAPLWRRAFASALDWVLAVVLFVLVGYPLGMIETLGNAIGGSLGRVLFWGAEGVALAVVAGYFAYFLSTGHTLGMRALDIHVFSHRSGREPHIVQGAVRGVLALAFFLASFKAYTYLQEEEPLTGWQRVWRDLAVTGAALAFLGNTWKLVDADGRTLWDRLLGLVVVEDVVPTSMPGRLWSPWGT